MFFDAHPFLLVDRKSSVYKFDWMRNQLQIFLYYELWIQTNFHMRLIRSLTIYVKQTTTKKKLKDIARLKLAQKINKYNAIHLYQKLPHQISSPKMSH